MQRIGGMEQFCTWTDVDGLNVVKQKVSVGQVRNGGWSVSCRDKEMKLWKLTLHFETSGNPC